MCSCSRRHRILDCTLRSLHLLEDRHGDFRVPLQMVHAFLGAREFAISLPPRWRVCKGRMHDTLARLPKLRHLAATDKRGQVEHVILPAEETFRQRKLIIVRICTLDAGKGFSG